MRHASDSSGHGGSGDPERLRTLGLVMIVRNEAAIIRRCLESVRPFVDCWTICDTGSTDTTRETVKEFLAGIPGELYDTPWVDFGSNRTVAMELARGQADYHLLIDADMVLKAPGEFRQQLVADGYLMRHEGPLDYWVERVVSDRHEWRYRGVTHECIESPTAKHWEKLPGVSISHFEDGSSRATKYTRDIALLEAAVAEKPEDPRSAYYLAQSYRDSGKLARAVEWYEKRASMSGWEEERWHARYQAARLQHRMGVTWPLVLALYLNAFEERPTRAEPLYWVARAYRESGQPRTALLFIEAGLRLPYPDDQLFIEREIYEGGLESERSACLSSLDGLDPETTEFPD